MAVEPDNSSHDHLCPELLQLGKKLKQLRIKRGYTSYEKFALDHGIHRVQYSRYEKGQDLNFSTLVKLLKALNITLAEFFSEGFD